MEARKLLDVEDEDGRQKRLGQLLMKVDQAGGTPSDSAELPATLQPNRIAWASTPPLVEPPTELLNRVRDFLPQLAESNTSLSSRDQSELDIENITNDGSYYIEMNLGLGVFERRRREARSDNRSSTSVSSSSSSTSECDSEESSEESGSSSSSSSSCSEDDDQPAARPKKPLPKRARPSITVLGGPEKVAGGSSA